MVERLPSDEDDDYDNSNEDDNDDDFDDDDEDENSEEWLYPPPWSGRRSKRKLRVHTSSSPHTQ